MEIKELKQKFIELYGGSESDLRVFSAAGRVNLIGEHIDYCGGKVFPAALNLRTVIVARLNGENVIRLAATTMPQKEILDISSLDAYRGLKWGDYQAGVAYVMQNEGYDIVGCDTLYDTTVPFASGLSSSASIEVATAMMFATFSAEKGVKNVDKMSQKEYREAAIKAVKKLAKDVGIPKTLKDIGVKKEDLEALSEAAMADVCTGGNPRPCCKKEILAVYQKAFNGK